MEAYILENEFLIVKVLKEFGGKIGSIYNKKLDYEVLFQPEKKSYEIPILSDSFSKYDTSGVDEMLPTIDECFYPNSYRKLNDHGDIWAQKWKFKEGDEGLECSVRCDSIKLDLKRKIKLEGESILLDYELYNPTEQELFYLWAFHPLMNFDGSSELEFSTNSEIVNVMDENKYDFNYLKLGEYPDDGEYKFYFKEPLEEGFARIIHKEKNVVVEFNFDIEINKYLGVWVTTGGFKGESNFAIEPASGFYDSLERAYKNEKVSKIDSKETRKWQLKLEVRKLR